VTCAEPPVAPTTAPTFTAAPDPSVAEGAFWEVRLRTTCGEVRLLLDGGRAPRSLASFVTLARAGYWDDSVCHRLTSQPAPTAFLQCGDATGHSTANPGYDLPLENVPADRTYRAGDLGMARGDGYPGTAGEFFIVYRDFTLPAGRVLYSLLGRVLSGQDVVQHIAAIGGEDSRSDGPPFQSISVLGVDVRRR
jgi:peptidyl-prolyl cis-trans isomerase B (cyclophilin B)